MEQLTHKGGPFYYEYYNSCIFHRCLINITLIVFKYTQYRKKKDNFFSRELTSENLDDFTWEKAVKEIQEDMPTVYEITEELMPKPHHLQSQRIKGHAGQKQ